jgi:hypothetical protein
LFLWLEKKVDTSWAPAGGNRYAYFLLREITWGLKHAVEKDMLLILDIISIT